MRSTRHQALSLNAPVYSCWVTFLQILPFFKSSFSSNALHQTPGSFFQCASVFLLSDVSSNVPLLQKFFLQMRSFFKCTPPGTEGSSLTEVDNAGYTIMVREIVGESGCSHLSCRPAMVSLVQNTWNSKIMAVLKTIPLKSYLLWCGLAMWQVGGTLTLQGTCSSRSLPSSRSSWGPRQPACPSWGLSGSWGGGRLWRRVHPEICRPLWCPAVPWRSCSAAGGARQSWGCPGSSSFLSHTLPALSHDPGWWSEFDIPPTDSGRLLLHHLPARSLVDTRHRSWAKQGRSSHLPCVCAGRGCWGSTLWDLLSLDPSTDRDCCWPIFSTYGLPLSRPSRWPWSCLDRRRLLCATGPGSGLSRAWHRPSPAGESCRHPPPAGSVLKLFDPEHIFIKYNGGK